MLKTKLQHLLIFLLLSSFLSVRLYAESANKEPSTSNAASNGSFISKFSEKASSFISNTIISSGFGLIRAYKMIGQQDLGANGGADVKLSHLSANNFRGKKVYATLRFLPFNVGPDSTTNGVTQEYSGSMNTYAAGAEALLASIHKFDFLSSIEIGFFETALKELVPVTESDRPIPRLGTLFIAGGEVRYKPYEKFNVGSRLYLATGSISYVSLFLSASFLF